MLTAWQAIILVGIVAVAILAGTFIGAYAVFRAKRESHESFVGVPAKGDVFSIDNFGEDLEPEAEETPKAPENVQKRSADFIQQFAGRLDEQEAA